MALTDGSENGMVMPVQPMGNYGGCNNGFGFGGDWAWIILLFLIGGNGWGMGGFGGFGGGLGIDFPWILNGQQGINANTNAGFRDAMINDGINGIRDGIGDLSTQICGSTASVTQAINSGFANAESAASARQMADMQTTFAAQTAITQGMNTIASGLQNCCCENRANIADLKYTVATENCADRAALSDGIRDLLAATQAQTQTILTQMCNDKIESKNDTIAQLRQELLYARGQASQDVQTARLLAGQTAEVDALYDRLNNCPVGTVPVYGRQPIFSCNNNGCGCGCGV